MRSLAVFDTFLRKSYPNHFIFFSIVVLSKRILRAKDYMYIYVL